MIASRPSSVSWRVPVAANGCSGRCGSSGCQCPSSQVNHWFRPWSYTDTGRLKNFASSTPQPVPPLTVPSGWIQPTAKTW